MATKLSARLREIVDALPLRENQAENFILTGGIHGSWFRSEPSNLNSKMGQTLKAEGILNQIHPDTKLGDLRKIAKDIGKDHGLAMELWSSGNFLPRQLAILLMDSKRVSQSLVDALDKDMQTHPIDERNQLIDWLMAN